MASISTCRTDSEHKIQRKLDRYLELIDNLAIDESIEIDMSNKSEAQKKLIWNLAIEIDNILPEDIKPLYQTQLEILNEMWNQQMDARKCSQLLLDQIKSQDNLNKTMEKYINVFSQSSNVNENEDEETKQLKIEFKKHKDQLEYLMDNFCSEEYKDVLKSLMVAIEDPEGDGYLEMDENTDVDIVQMLFNQKLILSHPTIKSKIKFNDLS